MHIHVLGYIQLCYVIRSEPQIHEKLEAVYMYMYIIFICA